MAEANRSPMVCTPEGTVDSGYTQRLGLARIGSVARTPLADSEKAWRETSESAKDIAQLIRDRLNSLLGDSGWTGRGADKFRTVVDNDLLKSLDDYAEHADRMAEALKPVNQSADDASATAESNDIPWDVDTLWSVQQSDPDRTFWGRVDEFITGDDDGYEEAKKNAPYHVLNGGGSVMKEVPKDLWESVLAQTASAPMPPEFHEAGVSVSNEVNRFDHALESLNINMMEKANVQSAENSVETCLSEYAPEPMQQMQFSGGQFAGDGGGNATVPAPGAGPDASAPGGTGSGGGTPVGVPGGPSASGGPEAHAPGADATVTPDIDQVSNEAGPDVQNQDPSFDAAGPDQHGPIGPNPGGPIPGGPDFAAPSPEMTDGPSIEVDQDWDLPSDSASMRDPQKIGLPPTTVEAGVAPTTHAPMPGNITPSGPMVGSPQALPGPHAGAPTLTPMGAGAPLGGGAPMGGAAPMAGGAPMRGGAGSMGGAMPTTRGMGAPGGMGAPMGGRGGSFSAGPLGRGLVNPGNVGPMAGPGGSAAGAAGGQAGGMGGMPMTGRGNNGRKEEKTSDIRVNNWLEEDTETWERASR